MPRSVAAAAAQDENAAVGNRRLFLARKDGRGDRIRTCDPLLPKQMRYQTALLPGDHPVPLIAMLANPLDWLRVAMVGPAGFEPAT